MGRQSSVIRRARFQRSLGDISHLLPYVPQVVNIRIYLIFEVYEQTKTLFVREGTRICDLPKILGVDKMYRIQLKEYWRETSDEPLVLEQWMQVYHNCIYTAEWVKLSEEIMYPVIVVD